MAKESVEPLGTLCLWEEPPFLLTYLESVGLGFIPSMAKKLKNFKHDHALTNLLVEYYVKEEGCFVFNNNRVFAGLVDVQIITGLSVSGKPVICKLPGETEWQKFCDDAFGFPLPDEAFEIVGKKRKPMLKLKWLRVHFGKKLKDAGGSLVQGTQIWTAYIKAYLMYVIGCYIAPCSSKGKVSIEYLGLLDNLNEVGNYAWGAASWTRMIEGLEKKKVNTLAAFLVVFMLEYIRPLRQKLVGNHELPTELPLLSPWCVKLSTVFSSTVHRGNAVDGYRLLLDNLRPDEVDVNPYARLNLQAYQDHLETAFRDTFCMDLKQANSHKASDFFTQYGYRSLDSSSRFHLPTFNKPIFRNMGPKQPIDLPHDPKFKMFVEAWQNSKPLRGELQEGWSAEKAPWLVSETLGSTPNIRQPDTPTGRSFSISFLSSGGTQIDQESERQVPSSILNLPRALFPGGEIHVEDGSVQGTNSTPVSDQARTSSGVAVAPEAEPRVSEEGLFLSNLLHQVMPLISQAATREPGLVPAEAEISSEHTMAYNSSTVAENSNVGTSRRHSQSDCDESPSSKRQKKE